MDQIYAIRQGWTIIFVWGPLWEGRICRRAMPSCGSRSKSRFLATAPIFTMRSWRKFQILRFTWMLLRATENVVAGHIWPAVRYLPTCVIRYWHITWKCKRVIKYSLLLPMPHCPASAELMIGIFFLELMWHEVLQHCARTVLKRSRVIWVIN